jgi:hypothetical protein
MSEGEQIPEGTTKEIVVKPYTDSVTGKFKEGNPGGGRPKGSRVSITAKVKEMLEEVPEGEKATRLQLIVELIFKKALKDGDESILKSIWNYIDGLPKNIVGFDPDDFISEVEIKIKTKDKNEVGTSINSSVPEELGGIPKQTT